MGWSLIAVAICSTRCWSVLVIGDGAVFEGRVTCSASEWSATQPAGTCLLLAPLDQAFTASWLLPSRASVPSVCVCVCVCVALCGRSNG
jgi:hypothetical protein